MDLINKSVDFEIGTVIKAIGPPSANWLCADGSILDQANYSQYVAVAQDLHPRCYERLQLLSNRTEIPKSCARVGNIIVVVGKGTEVLYTTDGGQNWNVNNPLGGLSTDYYYNVVTDGTTFVTMRYNSAVAYTSTDGVNWTSRTMTQTKNWNDLVWTGNYFVATSLSGSPRPLDYSADGITWYAASFPDNYWGSDYGVGGNNYLLYYSYNDYKWHRSVDGGQNWVTSTDPMQWFSPEYEGLSPDVVTFDGTYFNLWFNTYSSSFWLRSTNGFDWEWIPFTGDRYGSYEFQPQTGNYDGSRHLFMMQGYSKNYPIWYIGDGDIKNYHPRISTFINFATSNIARNRIAVIPGTGMFMVGNNGVDIEIWSDFTEYESTTKFQLPILSDGLPSGLKRYIKVS